MPELIRFVFDFLPSEADKSTDTDRGSLQSRSNVANCTRNQEELCFKNIIWKWSKTSKDHGRLPNCQFSVRHIGLPISQTSRKDRAIYIMFVRYILWVRRTTQAETRSMLHRRCISSKVFALMQYHAINCVLVSLTCKRDSCPKNGQV